MGIPKLETGPQKSVLLQMLADIRVDLLSREATSVSQFQEFPLNTTRSRLEHGPIDMRKGTNQAIQDRWIFLIA